MTMINKHSKNLWLGAGIVAAAFGPTDFAEAQASVACGPFDSGCEQFLPDARNDSTTTAFSSLQVRSNQVCVEDLAAGVTVTLDVDHTWIGDLVITLASPTGMSPVTLLDRLGNRQMPSVTGGCDGNSAQVSFGDGGGDQYCFTREMSNDPLFTPADGAMADLLAGAIAGKWQLGITDAGTGNFGALQGWSLEFDCDSIEDDRIFRDSFENAP